MYLSTSQVASVLTFLGQVTAHPTALQVSRVATKDNFPQLVKRVPGFSPPLGGSSPGTTSSDQSAHQTSPSRAGQSLGTGTSITNPQVCVTAGVFSSHGLEYEQFVLGSDDDGRQCSSVTSPIEQIFGWRTDFQWSGDSHKLKGLARVRRQVELPLVEFPSILVRWDYTISEAATAAVVYTVTLANSPRDPTRADIVVVLSAPGVEGQLVQDPFTNVVSRGDVQVDGANYDLWSGTKKDRHGETWPVWTFVSQQESTNSYKGNLIEYVKYIDVNYGFEFDTTYINRAAGSVMTYLGPEGSFVDSTAFSIDIDAAGTSGLSQGSGTSESSIPPVHGNSHYFPPDEPSEDAVSGHRDSLSPADGASSTSEQQPFKYPDHTGHTGSSGTSYHAGKSGNSDASGNSGTSDYFGNSDNSGGSIHGGNSKPFDKSGNTGESGNSGYSGNSGNSGNSGKSGSSGASSSSVNSGTSGASGSSGVSIKSGYTGQSVNFGEPGFSGHSGSSGSSEPHHHH